MAPNERPVVITEALVATMTGDDDGGTRTGFIDDGAIVIDGPRIAWVGPRADLPTEWRPADHWSAGGRLVTPGLVECHSHLIFGGDRRADFASRATGDSYQDLAGRSGILATVEATRETSDQELLDAAVRRAWWFIRQGVTTLEVKTGYGLDPEGELRLLRVAERLRTALPIRVRITLLAGHTYPRDADQEEYIITLCDELLPAAIAQGVLDSVEVYCEETVGITMEDASTILETVYRKKIPTRISADHLSDSAGGALAPAFYSRAAAHLNFTDDIAVKAMSRAGTTAVLLPGSSLELGVAEHRPPIDLLRTHRVPIAVSTGYNPGTSPLADLRIAAHLGCLLYGLTPAEALRGITANAARALALDDGTGTLAAGAVADLAVWDVGHPDELVYWTGAPLCQSVWSSGRLVPREGVGISI
jgi:imidazolonepropionase